MKAFIASLLVLPFLLARAQDNGDCPTGFEPMEIPPGSGNIVCRKTVTFCLGGDDRAYLNQATNAHGCCVPSQQLVIYDDKTRAGVCCGQDQIYAGIAPNGKCCQKGQVLQNGNCVPAPPPTACAGCPSQPPGACQLQAACGDSVNNGLQYGSCYQLLFPNGQQLGRGVGAANDQYTQDGYIQNIPYKICKLAAGDCGTGPVTAKDTFYIQDMIGPVAATDGSTGWIDASVGGPHMQLTTAAAQAGKFNGKTSCSSCKCVVQLTGMGYACPSQQPGITFWANQKVTLKLQFLQIPCNGKYNFPQPATLN